SCARSTPLRTPWRWSAWAPTSTASVPPSRPRGWPARYCPVPRDRSPSWQSPHSTTPAGWCACGRWWVCWLLLVDRVDHGLRVVLVLGVGVRECRALHGLRGHGDRHVLPARHVLQRGQELAGGGGRIHQLIYGAPAGGGALLEQADRVVVVAGAV